MMAYTLAELATGVEHHLERICDGFGLKAGLAAVPAAFAGLLGGNWHLFEAWFVLNIADLMVGTLVAIKSVDPVTGRCRFSKNKVYGWVIKTLTHMLTIIMVGVMTVFFAQISGYSLPLIDWFVFILLLTEIASILDGAAKLGLPVHPLARAMVAKIRKNTEEKIDAALEADEKASAEK